MGLGCKNRHIIYYNNAMKTKLLKADNNEIEKQLKSLNLETLRLLAGNHEKAQDYIKIGRGVAGGNRLSSKQIKEMATEMQVLAKMLLDEKRNNG